MGMAPTAARLGEAHVLILSSLREFTGNSVTASRLAAAIRAHRTSLLDVADLADADALAAHVCAHRVTAVIGIHAYRAGRLLIGSRVPYVLVLGGTDVNVNLAHEEKRSAMAAALGAAAAIAAFHDAMADDLLRALPEIPRDRVFLVPQAVGSPLLPRAPPPPGAPPSSVLAGCDAHTVESVRSQLDVPDGAHLLLLPAGVRPVKDVLFGALALADAERRRTAPDDDPTLPPRLCLRVVGPELDAAYAATVRAQLDALRPRGAAAWVGPMGRTELHVAMAISLCVLNTSASEARDTPEICARDMRPRYAPEPAAGMRLRLLSRRRR